jgi:TonB-linked SusC/RagA family outer membrane protein
VNVNRKVNAEFNDRKISDILDDMFEDTGIKYEIQNRHIILKKIYDASSQGEVKVTGRVTDNDGEPLPGVTIIVKGTSSGTITDLDGMYELTAMSDATLQFSFIGFEAQSVTVAGRTIIDVVLQMDTRQLGEVVAIGYGTVKKRDLTGSVASVQGATLEKIPVANVSEALAGRLAGVKITTADGSPDAEIIVRVRGGGSVTGDNSPLYIVDGFPVSSISDIAATDIESVDVLKDASSSAIYGSQGANGVIIITTKSAKGGKTVVNYNGYLQTKSVANKMDVLDTYEYTMLNYELAALNGEDGIESFERSFGVFDDLDLYKYIEGTDWQEDDLFGSNVLSKQHNISALKAH